MYQVDFQKPIHVHFIGIGGISMSGLAEILLEEKFRITGSDSTYSALTEELVKKGAHIYIGQKASNIEDSVELVVYTAAIHEDNEELMEVRRRNIPTLTRAQFLGQLMRNYKFPVAVSGTHGKTTTTSMITQILLENEMDPTISVGGILKSINGNIKVGKSEIFVTEACEYTNSFLNFFPKIGIILNIEEDHLDFFKDIKDIRHSFHEFANNINQKEGSLIINGEIPDLELFEEGLNCNIITYGIDGDYDYCAKNVTYDEFVRGSFDLYKKGVFVARIGLGVTGHHNVSNALPAIALSDMLDIPIRSIQKGLLSFTGTDRRFEYKGTYNGAKIIDDYAHHPTEITATLKTARRYPHNEIWCIFQPHTYTRTRAFYNDFVCCFNIIDHIIVADIFAARETDTLGMSAKKMAEDMKANGCDAYYVGDFKEIEKFIKNRLNVGDLLITMGAGNIVEIGENILSE